MSEIFKDYEFCGDCGFDHQYEPNQSTEWHQLNPGSYTTQVIRGDSFKIASKWPENCADLIVTDPPYGKIVDEEWDKDWDSVDFDMLGNLIHHILKPGGTAYVWGGIGKVQYRPFLMWLASLEQLVPLRIHDIITWCKKRAYGKDNSYLFTREECVMLVKPMSGHTLEKTRPKTFHIPLLDEKRGYPGYNKDYPAKSEYLRRTNVWTDVTELFTGKIHPTEKPSRLAEIMIETSSNPNELVVDLFAGSGSTGVAARKLGRRCVLIEKSNCQMHVETC